VNTWVIEWTAALEVPRRNKVHEAVNAFLETSREGAWMFDDTEENTPRVLNYRRGPWERSFFGWGNRLIPVPFHRVTSLLPMRLVVEVKFLPLEILLTIHHQLFLKGLKNEKAREAEERRCADSVRAEMDALAAFLRKASGPDAFVYE
jgi:hypothetical protein